MNIEKAVNLIKEIANDKNPYYHTQERVMFNEIWYFDVCKYCGGDNGSDVKNVKHKKNCIWMRAKKIMED